jgi:hypothetical protein
VVSNKKSGLDLASGSQAQFFVRTPTKLRRSSLLASNVQNLSGLGSRLGGQSGVLQITSDLAPS